MNDWDHTYMSSVWAWLNGLDPYATVQIFGSPPWTLPLMVPLAWIPPEWARWLPALALLFVAYRHQKRYLLPLVGISVPFIFCSVYANLDWMSMIAVSVGGWLGVILNTFKPQASLFANVAELAKQPTLSSRVRLLLPLGILALLTAPLMGIWLYWMFSLVDHNTIRNFSLFPYSIPAGILGIVLAWRRQSVLWGVVASLALAPYHSIASTLPLLFLLAERDWRWGLAFNLATWVLLFVIMLGYIPIDL